MTFPDIDDPQGVVLSQALRGVRRLRGLSAAEIARRMGLALRTYEHFESGAGRLRLDRIFSFAAATDSDPFAILASVLLGSEELAVRCADSMLVRVFKGALWNLNAELGDDLRLLTARDCVWAFNTCLEDLAAIARQRRAQNQTYCRQSGSEACAPQPSPANDAAPDDERR